MAQNRGHTLKLLPHFQSQVGPVLIKTISCIIIINITCQSSLENKLLVTISRVTRMLNSCRLLEETVNCLVVGLA